MSMKVECVKGVLGEVVGKTQRLTTTHNQENEQLVGVQLVEYSGQEVTVRLFFDEGNSDVTPDQIVFMVYNSEKKNSADNIVSPCRIILPGYNLRAFFLLDAEKEIEVSVFDSKHK